MVKNISTMQKTSLEWDTFKSKQGIGDELERYTKNGYLAKQDFLGRVDLRQFEQKSLNVKVRRYERVKKGQGEEIDLRLISILKRECHVGIVITAASQETQCRLPEMGLQVVVQVPGVRVPN